jgi:hypothetical protein
MPPRRRSASGFKGVRPCPNGLFYAEIRTVGFRLTLGTYHSPEEAVRVYDMAAWPLGRPRWQMNFPETESLEEAQFLTPQPHLVTEEDRHLHREAQRRLLIAEHDERAMAAWHREFPQDVQAELEFYRSRRAERWAYRADRRWCKAFINAQLAGPQTINDDDPRWDDLWTQPEDTSSDDDEA